MATRFKNPEKTIGSTPDRGVGEAETPIPLSWMLVATAVSLVALTALMIQTHLSIALNGAALVFAVMGAILLAARHIFRAAGPRPRTAVSASAEDALLFILISLMGAVASYGVAALTVGWMDDAMVRIDQAIGFDWNALYTLTSDRPAIAIGGRIAYASIFASPAILLLSFAIHGQRDEARRFLAAFWLAAAVSLILFRWLPTLGPLDYMWHGSIDYMPTSGLYQAELIPMLREGRAGPIDLGALRGLVGPPSFHAASAVLYSLAAWRTHNLRWPLTILNGLMLLSIPVEGTHYAVDVISGAAVALVSHAVIQSIASARRNGRRPVA